MRRKNFFFYRSRARNFYPKKMVRERRNERIGGDIGGRERERDKEFNYGR